MGLEDVDTQLAMEANVSAFEECPGKKFACVKGKGHQGAHTTNLTYRPKHAPAFFIAPPTDSARTRGSTARGNDPVPSDHEEDEEEEDEEESEAEEEGEDGEEEGGDEEGAEGVSRGWRDTNKVYISLYCYPNTNDCY